MIFCQKCVTKLIDGRCPKCNPAVEVRPFEAKHSETKPPQNQESYRNALPPIPPINFSNSDEIWEFLSIETEITPACIKSIYMPVLIAIVVGTLLTMFSGGVGMFFLGLVGGAVVLILFRIACEILLSLSSINKKLSKTEAEPPAQAENPERV